MLYSQTIKMASTIYMTNDIASRFISMLIPPIIAECSRRISQIEKFGHSPQAGDYDLMRLTEQVSADMVKECDFDFEESDEENADSMPKSASALGVREENDLTPIQNLKLDLLELFKETREKLITEIKDSIKDELRMELFLELTTLKTEMLAAGGLKTAPSAGSSVKKEFGTAVLPQFSLEIGATNNVAPVLGGFESIASSITFDSQKPADVEKDLLANNPLFARVAKNLDRAKQGKAMYTPEEVITARENRFEKKEIEKFQLRVAKSKYEFESDDEAEDSRWDQLLKDKLQAGM